MTNGFWSISASHAYAPGHAPLLSLETLQGLWPLDTSAASIAGTLVIAFVLIRAVDHLFSPPIQRRLGPRQRR